MKNVNYDRAKEVRDWSNWLITLLIVPALWVGKLWMENHDMKVTNDIRSTYETKNDAAIIENTSIKRDEAIQNQVANISDKQDKEHGFLIRIDGKIDNLSDRLAKHDNKERQN
jgi:hypothetical protein